MVRNWPRHALALDMHLAGHSNNEIARALGVSKQRASVCVKVAARQLAFRVFKGLPRPLPPPPR
jgi:hypothetical protein